MNTISPYRLVGSGFTRDVKPFFCSILQHHRQKNPKTSQMWFCNTNSRVGCPKPPCIAKPAQSLLKQHIDDNLEMASTKKTHILKFGANVCFKFHGHTSPDYISKSDLAMEIHVLVVYHSVIYRHAVRPMLLRYSLNCMAELLLSLWQLPIWMTWHQRSSSTFIILSERRTHRILHSQNQVWCQQNVWLGLQQKQQYCTKQSLLVH